MLETAKVPISTTVGSKNVGTFTQWNTMQQKEGTPSVGDIMDGTGEYYAR